MAPKTPNPSLTRFYFNGGAVSDFRDRRLTHPHGDHERDTALVVQSAHELCVSTTHRELSGAVWTLATTGALPREYAERHRLPAMSVTYDTFQYAGLTYYLVDHVFYDGAAVRAVVALSTVTALT